jgi:hypothetical protein
MVRTANGLDHSSRFDAPRATAQLTTRAGSASRCPSAAREHLGVSARRIGWRHARALRCAEDRGRFRQGGSLMRHAQPAPSPVGALPIAMFQPALGARLITAAGGPETLHATGAAAGRAAVRVAAIAGPAGEEQPLTPAAGTDAEERHTGSGAGSRSSSPSSSASGAVRRTPSRPRRNATRKRWTSEQPPSSVRRSSGSGGGIWRRYDSSWRLRFPLGFPGRQCYSSDVLARAGGRTHTTPAHGHPWPRTRRWSCARE